MNISLKSLLRKVRENFWLSGIFLTIVTSAFTLVIFNNLSIAKLAENHLSDVRIAMLSRPLPQSTNIAIVLITDKTLENFPYRSPLDRSLVTRILDKLDSSSVAGIGINVLFDRPTEPIKDDALYQKLQQLTVPVVASQVSSISGFSASQIQYSNQFLKNIRTGLSMIYRDPVDHTIRAAILRMVQGRTVHLGFSAKLADVFGLDLPQDEKIYIDYRSGPDYATTAFPIYLAHELDAVPKAWLQNRIVLVGTDLGSSSRLRTPLSVLSSGFDRDLPGVVVEAHILSQIIEGRTLHFASNSEKFWYVVLMAVLGCLISSLSIRFFFKLVIILMVVPASWMVAFSVYYFGNHIVPMVAPTAAFLAAIVFSIFWQWRAEQQRRERIHHSFGQYLAPSVVEKILSNSEDLDLEGEVREITFLFTDLEGFTALVESTPPHQMVELVNRYLEEACNIVIEHGGTIDKIVGDALHVMFNAPLFQPDHAQRAVTCALALDDWSEAFRKRIKKETDLQLGVTRIGVNTGQCVVGNFGGKHRFDYTAHGDAINSTARLEAINQRLGTTICVSESSVAQCSGIHFRPVATLILRGKTIGMEVFVPVSEDRTDLTLSEQYREAYEALGSNAENSDDLFTTLEHQYPDDPLVQLHARRIDAGESGTTLVIRKK